MKRNFFKLAGIFGLVLVFGLALVGCDQSAEIFVANHSDVIGTDGSVRVEVWGARAGLTPLRVEEVVPYGFTAHFSLDLGDYRVRVTPIGPDGPLDRHFSFPQDERALFMGGTFRLRFDGHEVVRTN